MIAIEGFTNEEITKVARALHAYLKAHKRRKSKSLELEFDELTDGVKTKFIGDVISVIFALRECGYRMGKKEDVIIKKKLRGIRTRPRPIKITKITKI